MTSRTLSEIAELCGAVLEGDGNRVIHGPARLETASPEEISFLANPRYRGLLATTRAGAVVLGEDVDTDRPDFDVLRCADPNSAFSRIISSFAVEEARPAPGVHPSAVIDPTAELGTDVCIGPFCIVGAGVRLADGVVLLGSVTVAERCTIGAGTLLYPGVTIFAGVSVGARCIVHAGAVIGDEGFGFEPTAEGWNKIPQCGTVLIEDDVEVGANTTIDRARFGATRIGRGAKIDNLVHVAHNVDVGENALLVAQVGIAGSSTIGPRAVLGGQVGVSGHVQIGAGAQVAAQAGVFGNIDGGVEYLGFPARPRRHALRTLALTGRLPQMLERLQALERRLGALEQPAADPADAGEGTPG